MTEEKNAKRIILELDATENAREDLSKAFTPEIQEQMAALGHLFAQQSSELKKTAQRVAEQLRENLGSVFQQFNDATFGFWRQAIFNWRGVADLERLVEIVVQDGYCLVWVPPAEVITELLLVDTREKRDQILVVHSELILDSIRDELTRCTASGLDSPRAAVEEAVNAFHDGHEMAAQTLASSTLTHILQTVFEHKRFSDAREAWDLSTEPMAGIVIRIRLLGSCTARAIQHTDYAPPGYNRHATAHGVAPADFTTANCLNSLMLAAAWVREIQAEIDYETRRVAEQRRAVLTNAVGVRRIRESEAFRNATEGISEPPDSSERGAFEPS